MIFMKDFIKNLIKLDDTELQTFLSAGFNKIIEPKKIFINEGEKFDRLFFIHSGIIRSFRLIDGKDYSFFFHTEKEFAIDYESFLLGISTPLFFETITECNVTEYKKDILDTLYEKIPRLEKLGRIIAEQAYLNVHERLLQFQSDDLETRYLKLIKRNPNLFQFVPLYHIASYLGVKPQSLSRIRAKIAHVRN
jgi:CRP/FNR family transcriptional regulator, anaerobic regulatory protein